MKVKTKEDVVEMLLDREVKNKTLIVLFDDSKSLRSYGGSVAEAVRADSSILHDRNTPFKVTNKLIRVGDKRVLLGLRSVSENLISGYRDAEVLDGV